MLLCHPTFHGSPAQHSDAMTCQSRSGSLSQRSFGPSLFFSLHKSGTTEIYYGGSVVPGCSSFSQLNYNCSVLLGFTALFYSLETPLGNLRSCREGQAALPLPTSPFQPSLSRRESQRDRRALNSGFPEKHWSLSFFIPTVSRVRRQYYHKEGEILVCVFVCKNNCLQWLFTFQILFVSHVVVVFVFEKLLIQ